MTAAIALDDDNNLAHQARIPSRHDVLARYRYLRDIATQHQFNAMKFLSKDTLLHHARRLGLTVGKTLMLDSLEELIPAMDLAIHTAAEGRSRAIDRYARSARIAPGSDEALVLEAMCNARFAVISVQGRHEVAGLVATDVFRKIELWLVDVGLEMSLPEGGVFATRYFTPDRFAMTVSVGLPIDLALLMSAVRSTPQLLRRSRAEAIQDRRFAEAVYRAAIADGVLDHAEKAG